MPVEGGLPGLGDVVAATVGVGGEWEHIDGSIGNAVEQVSGVLGGCVGRDLPRMVEDVDKFGVRDEGSFNFASVD